MLHTFKNPSNATKNAVLTLDIYDISLVGFRDWIFSKFEIKSIPSQIGFAQDQVDIYPNQCGRDFYIISTRDKISTGHAKLSRNTRIAHVWIHRVRRISIDRISRESSSFQEATRAIIKLLGLLILSSTVYTE